MEIKWHLIENKACIDVASLKIDFDILIIALCCVGGHLSTSNLLLYN